MHTTLFKRFAIALLFTVGLARWAAADPIDDLAAKIKADHDYVLTHPQTIDPEALRLQHDAEMVKDMQERAKEVEADHAAYNKHLQEWLQKMKDQAAAERLAEAAAKQAEIDAREKALTDALIRSEIRTNNSASRANDAYTNYMTH